MDDQFIVRVSADTSAFSRSLESLEREAGRFGATLTGALKSAVASGEGLEGILRRIGLDLAGRALDAGLRPLESLFDSVVGRMFSAVTPFAKGGVVGAPTLFSAGAGLGLMGEAGAEAVLPLARDAGGRLGVAAGQGGGPVTVNVTIQAADPAAFRASQGQIAAMLARSVARGSRSL